MSSQSITPVILTYNEAPNIGVTLGSVQWAPRVVVVDSGSSDDTRAIAVGFPNVVFVTRAFDTHSAQWSFGVHHPEATGTFVLALDADMQVSEELHHELLVALAEGASGVMVPIRYAIRGRVLRGSLYPPQLRFFDKRKVRITQVGHTQRFEVSGEVRWARGPLVHDDRKPLEDWVRSQLRYSAIESGRLLKDEMAGIKGSIRRRCPALPALVGLYAYLKSGGPLGGGAARRYALERMLFEALLRWRLVDNQLTQPRSGSGSG